MSRTFDYIIVGAGAAGCVLANRLSEDGQKRVALIEAGGAVPWWDFRPRMPLATSLAIGSSRYNWGFVSEPMPYAGDRRGLLHRGRVLGGSTTINGMVYMRGNPADYDRWAVEPGMQDWRFSRCLPYFRRLECYDHGSDAYRGDAGPVAVERAVPQNPLYSVFIEAGLEAGHCFISDFNGYRQEGVGLFDRAVRRGTRESAATAYLSPITRRRNLHVLTGRRVVRVLMQHGRATGVELFRGGHLERIDAEAEVILSAGAIQSPQLLMLSGIGPADHLRRHGISVLHDSPGVGQNLCDHLEMLVQHECLRPVSLYRHVGPIRQSRLGLEWLLRRSGIGATNMFEAGGFFRSNDTLEYPDTQIHFVAAAIDYGKKLGISKHGFQAHPGPMHMHSRGMIELVGPNALVAPRIQPGWLTDERDVVALRNAVRLTRNIFSQRAFAPYRGLETAPGPEIQSDADIDAHIRQTASTAYHFVGTCRMGTGVGAVVGPDLDVHGVQRLRVIDASVMPCTPTGNTTVPVMMIAEKAAAILLGEAPLEQSAPYYRAMAK